MKGSASSVVSACPTAVPTSCTFFYSLGDRRQRCDSQPPNDRYGFGFYYLDVNNPELQGVFRDVKLLRDEYGFEAFYNFAITPWLQVTPDIQIVRGAQKEKITIGTGAGPIGVSL